MWRKLLHAQDILQLCIQGQSSGTIVPGAGLGEPALYSTLAEIVTDTDSGAAEAASTRVGGSGRKAVAIPPTLLYLVI